MATPKLSIPSVQYLLNILIAMAIISFVFKMLPPQYTQWFRW